MSKYSSEELRPTGVSEFRSILVKETPTYPGSSKMHREYAGESYVPTSVGCFQEDEWVEMAREAILSEGKEELLEKVVEYVSHHCVWLRSKKEIEAYSINCLLCGSYKAWEERGGFHL